MGFARPGRPPRVRIAFIASPSCGIKYTEFPGWSFGVVPSTWVVSPCIPSSGSRGPRGARWFHLRSDRGWHFHYRMLREELGWNQQKSDELLLPVIQRMNRRGAAATANKQSMLDAYFNDSVGSVGGSAIPRKRQAYTSKRLQKVVTDYREEQRRRSRTTAKGKASTVLDSDGSGDEDMEDFNVDEDLPAGLGQDLYVGGSDDRGERDPTSGPVTRTGKASKRTKSPTTAPTKRRTGSENRKSVKFSGNSTTAPRSTKRKKRANDSDDYNDGDEHADGDEATLIPARARPKPVRKKVNTNSGVEANTAVQDRSG